MPTSMAALEGLASGRIELNSTGMERAPITPGMEPANFHWRIRSETRVAHDQVDAAMIGFDLKKARGYADFLACHAQALSGLQLAVRGEDRPDMDEMIDRLDADLRILGVDATAPSAGLTDVDGFGVAYVIRGSRMGARVLRPRIGANLPTRYMDFAPKVPWRVFLAELEIHAAAGDDERRALIITSALQTFAAFITAPEVSA